MAKSLGKMRKPHGRESLTHIKDLVPDPANRRAHNPRNIGMVVDALQAVGAARSIVIDECNVVLAGNGVHEAAAEAGITKVQVVEVDGSTLVAVRRKGLTAEQKRALAIWDNRTGELATWDFEQLQADKDAGLSLQPFWTQEEETALLKSGPKAGLTDPDHVPEEHPTDIRLGDLFELGKHRLLCGDSTKADDVALVMAGQKAGLMVTDPPYGISLDATWRDGVANRLGSAQKGKLHHDGGFEWALAISLAETDVAYVYHHHRFGSAVQSIIESAGYEVRQQIIWVKTVHTLTQSKYQQKHEPCWFAVRKGRNDHWCGGRDQMSVFELASPKHIMSGSIEQKMDHPTQKPVGCSIIPIQNHSSEYVYDPFLGSGTTLIASEQLGRMLRGIEIEPSYCQVIVDRWEAFTGQRAVKCGEAVRG